MTPQFSAQQNKMRLIAVFLFTVMIALSLYTLKGDPAGSTAEARDNAMFMGLREASAAEIHAALPESQGKPTLIEFTSRLCHDCQRMAPVVSKVMAQYPGTLFRKIDVLEDKKKHPALLRAFKPVSVPMLVLIDGQGKIRNVLYNYQPPEIIAKALAKIQPKPAKPAAVQKP